MRISMVIVIGCASSCSVEHVDEDDPAFPIAAAYCAAFAGCDCPGYPATDVDRDTCEHWQIEALGEPTLEGLRKKYPAMEFAFDPTGLEWVETWAEGLQCDGESTSAFDCTTQRCVGNLIYGPQREGEPCETSAQCARGLRCGRAIDGSDVCIDGCARTPSELGGPCGGYGESCEAGLSCSAGLCVIPGELGDPCETSSCADELYCDDVCQAQLAAGSACDSTDICESRRCVDGHCAPRPQLGEPCDSHLLCEHGLSCFDEVCSDVAALCSR
jgi:hypothetical protein